ncbi:MAG: acyl carrier protein [Ruminococcaceae bacterium]|nr:acyl carrier protein [Oscillospiraceae bacterium]
MFEELKAILADELDVPEDQITPDAEFVNDLKLNSLEIADLVVLCEDRFDIVIEEQDLHSIICIADLVEYVEQRTN